MSAVWQNSTMARFGTVLAINGLFAALAYALLRSLYLTPHQLLVDVIFLILVSTAHFWYMPIAGLRFRIWSGVASASLNALVMFWVAVALGDAL
jgi:hypothetical protein